MKGVHTREPRSRHLVGHASHQKIKAEVGVGALEADQCMFGFKTWGSSKHRLAPARKATNIMTNSRSVGKELKVKCDGSHEHQPLVGGRAKDAARYPPALC